ncbi:MAG: septum formation initiator family protein [Ruminococcus sp.]|nr:septum formation initiator family protein [Ruminococcus sp.]
MMKNDEKNAEAIKTNVSKPDADIKEIEPKKVRKKRHILLYIAIIGFVFYAVITIINQSVEISKKRIELQNLQQQINVVEIQTQYLEKVQNYTGKELEEYIEKIAKEDMGYIGEGERIFINVAGE